MKQIIKTFDLDKIAGPITRATGALKQFKEKSIQKALPSVYTTFKKVEKANSSLQRAEPVVDKSTYQARSALLDMLISACEAADKELSTFLSKPVHTPATVRKSGNSIEVTLLPDKINRPTVKDVPKLGAKLTELQTKVSELKKQAEAERKYLDGWYRDNIDRTGAIILLFNAPDTDMIADVAKGLIGLPPQQACRVRLTFDGVPDVLKSEEPKLKKLVEDQLKAALAPLKSDTKERFRKWNALFTRIQATFDEKSAHGLFKEINGYFSNELRAAINKELEGIRRGVLKDFRAMLRSPVLQKMLDGANVKVDLNIDYSGFARFVVSLPENPAEDFTDSFKTSLKDMEQTGKEYAEAVQKDDKVDSKRKELLEALRKVIADLEGSMEDLKGNVKIRQEELKSLRTSLKDMSQRLKRGAEVEGDLKRIRKHADALVR